MHPRCRALAAVLLEAVEPRWLLSTFLVTTAADTVNANDGVTSLREALFLAETAGDPGQVVTFAPALANQPIQLSDALGTMILSNGVQVQGLGGGQTVLNTSGTFRVFQVDAGESGALTGLVIAGPDPTNPASGTGGGVANNGTLTLTDCTIRGFYTAGGVGGAAIQNTGALTMTGGVLERDRSVQNGGTVYSTGSSASLTLTGVTVSNGGGGADGGAFFVNGGTLSLNGCTFQGNTSSIAGPETGGGAIYAVSVALRATDCRFVGNTSNAASFPLGGGGAIFASGGTLTLTDCTFAGNTDVNASGGAVYLEGTATLVGAGCTFNGNFAQNGGALAGEMNTIVRLANSTFSANTASFGGAMYIDFSPLVRLTNCTLSGNAATSSGGAAYILNSTLEYLFSNVTITGNRADSDGNGIGTVGGLDCVTGLVELENSIVAGNLLGSAAGTSTPSDVGSFLHGFFNLIGDGDGQQDFGNGIDGNQVGTAAAPIDPKLGPLADNGGPTLTHALLAGSPALDAGDKTRIQADFADLDGDGDTTEPVPFDQRGAGFARVFGAQVDLGAYEYIPAPPAAPTGLTATVRADGSVDLAWAEASQGVTEFDVERSNNPSFGAIDRTFALPVNTTAYHDVTTVGGTYFYSVHAANLGGNSPPSNVAGALVPVAGVSPDPGALFNLSIVSGLPASLSVTAGTVTLTSDLSKAYAGISLDVSGGATVVFAVDQNFLNVSLSGGGTISLGAPPPSGAGGSGSGTPISTPTPATPPVSQPQVLVASSAGYARDGAYANTDLSRDVSLVVKKGAPGQNRETYLTFDLSKLNGTIHTARLRLVGRLTQAAARGVAVRAYAVNGMPAKGALKWNDRPQAGTSALAAAVVSGTARHSYDWDLTAWLIAQKLAGKRTATIALKGAAMTEAAALFDTVRATTTAPRLIIS